SPAPSEPTTQSEGEPAPVEEQAAPADGEVTSVVGATSDTTVTIPPTDPVATNPPADVAPTATAADSESTAAAPAPTGSGPTSAPAQPTATIGSGDAGDSEETAPTVTIVPQGTPESAPPPLPSGGSAEPDFSGAQSALSGFEESAQSNNTYSGVLCRVGLIGGDFTCACDQQRTVTSLFSFADANNGNWIFDDGTASANYAIGRLGINTWAGSLQAEEGITIDVQLVFTSFGFQHTVTVNAPERGQAVCVMEWYTQ
ncbi:MAG: hypothetical protein GYB68_02800, partial [Chloroflexi bacterium]|nr:hypothetical protein [Chloroflexota bacterium]